MVKRRSRAQVGSRGCAAARGAASFPTRTPNRSGDVAARPPRAARVWCKTKFFVPCACSSFETEMRCPAFGVTCGTRGVESPPPRCRGPGRTGGLVGRVLVPPTIPGHVEALRVIPEQDCGVLRHRGALGSPGEMTQVQRMSGSPKEMRCNRCSKRKLSFPVKAQAEGRTRAVRATASHQGARSASGLLCCCFSAVPLFLQYFAASELEKQRSLFEKARPMRHRVTYLGLEICGGRRELGTERKEPACRTPEPATVKGLRTFLERTVDLFRSLWCPIAGKQQKLFTPADRI
ncbi:uncharacterized protein LOC135997793 isoform X2 [Caloenas nicobarica]|uniref:uncharacterized protein LOC135997793 isoform X2 n=1 Tax=Caloenas nicobarica TaxID=187106 RepID=UPI0032B7F4B4